MGKGNTRAVVKIKDGGKNGYYTFDITRPLEEHRKIFQWLVLVKSAKLLGNN